MIACRSGNTNVIHVLLNAGADPDIADSLNSETWIHYAVEGDCSKETLQAIINHGADVNTRNKKKEMTLPSKN